MSIPLEKIVKEESTPLVSVVIPAFQCAQYIAQAIDSVFAQTYFPYEVVIVNDGSPDTTLLQQVLSPYQHQIRYIEQETTGPAGARNVGIRQSHGEYLAFLDADDYWAEDHLSQQMSLFLEDPGLDVVYSNYVLLRNEKSFARAFDLQPQSTEVSFESLLTEDCAIGTSTAVCSRKSIIQAGLFDESLLRCEDFEMWLRMSLLGARMAYRSEVQVFHRINNAGLSADRLSMKRDRIRVYQKVASIASISEREQDIVRQLVARTEADCHVDVLKRALAKGDYTVALAAANDARALRNTWKLRASLFGLRLMPAFVRRIHLARSFFRRSGKSSGTPVKNAKVPLTENEAKSKDVAPLVGSGMGNS